MTTLLQACKEIVKNSINYDGYEKGTIKDIYYVEYGHNGINQKACESYLRGLPSVCTVPFADYEILEVLKSKGVSRKGVNAQDRLIDDYWEACGYAFYKLLGN